MPSFSAIPSNSLRKKERFVGSIRLSRSSRMSTQGAKARALSNAEAIPYSSPM